MEICKELHDVLDWPWPIYASSGNGAHLRTTIDQVDNIVRHMTGDADGHKSAEFTCLTCAVPEAAMQHAGGPSVDYVAGLRLRASESQRTNILFPSAPVPSTPCPAARRAAQARIPAVSAYGSLPDRCTSASRLPPAS